ncbi:hypothetical protein [Secundilactobacillus similis]|uniref:hypothetical protein n=1 Tax=Secundilactobacillus similis TaxID=414682 RepID=UPI0006D047AB|nr:hypothetical protein [Secundilactobacillus similis]
MSTHSTKRRRIIVTIIVSCLVLIFGASLLTREANLQSPSLLPRGKALMNSHVRVRFVTDSGHRLKTYYWSTSHSTGRGTDVTDIFNSDIIEEDSGINDHIPLDYSFDQTDLKNIRTLKSVKLGDTISLTVNKLPQRDRLKGLPRFIKWLVNG